MDLNYWTNVYEKNEMPSSPSKFALFVMDELNDRINTIVDVGCGNGRDSYFLGRTKEVVGVDNAVKPSNNGKVTFLNCSMSEINGKYDLLYSRFSLHSVDEDIENRLIDYAYKNCKIFGN